MAGSTALPVPLPVVPTTRHGSVFLLIPLAGASNAFAACFTNGFDLVKVRQQLQVSSSGSGAAGSTFWARTLYEMMRTEGVLSIYKGLSASLLREGLYSGVRMGCYDAAKRGIVGVTSSDPNAFSIKLGAGMLSGMLGAAIASPADLLKVRMQALGATGTLRHHARSIYAANGLAGLYRAVLPTTLRAGILTASQVGTYDHAKHTIMVDFPGVFQEGLVTHFAASGIAGFVCSAASSPVDVVKVRIMSDKTGQYKNALHCAALMLKNEGPLSFYKGFTMCFLRLWPHSVLSLLAFEQLRRLAGIKPI